MNTVANCYARHVGSFTWRVGFTDGMKHGCFDPYYQVCGVLATLVETNKFVPFNPTSPCME